VKPSEALLFFKNCARGLRAKKPSALYASPVKPHMDQMNKSSFLPRPGLLSFKKEVFPSLARP
jgi:hypothetical protein